MVSKFSQSLPRKPAFVLSHPTYSCVSALVDGSDIFLGNLLLVSSSVLRPSDRSFGGASSGLLIVPKFSLILRVFRSSQKDCFVISSDTPGSLFPDLIFFLISRKRRFRQDASLLSDKVLCVSVFPHVLRGG